MRSSGGRGGTLRGVNACAYPDPAASIDCCVSHVMYMHEHICCLHVSVGARSICVKKGKSVQRVWANLTLTMDKWEATYRNDRSSDRFVSEASASRVIYAAPGSTCVSAQPMTWQADETSVAVYNNPIASEVKSHRHSNIGINVHNLDLCFAP